MTGWQDTAPCKGLSKLFFPAHKERPKAGVIREAKALAICARCPHRTPCKEIADTMPSEPRGIFGGVIYRDMTDRSRQQRKQKAMTA